MQTLTKLASSQHGISPYGVDADYFHRKLARIIPRLENYRPGELAREFAQMAITADADAARAELSLASGQSGEAVAEMWAVYFDGEGTRYSSGFVTPWKLYEHQEAAQAEVDSLSDLPGRYMACKVFIYTRPQHAAAVPDRWRDVVRDLVALARVVSIALDDSEERQGDGGARSPYRQRQFRRGVRRFGQAGRIARRQTRLLARAGRQS
ncbi:hypothetical protein [Chromobacterium piscinae]|uniref:hypothetical protein n=1 Tax=Chromobacterium piscinae TaxID=686831 RepID=UPI00361E0080